MSWQKGNGWQWIQGLCSVSLRKSLAGGQREKTANSGSFPPPFAGQVTRSSLPSSYHFFCFQGKNAKNVIKSTSVFCLAVLPGHTAFWPPSCSHQLFSAVTGPESDRAWPVPFFVPTVFVCSRPDWRPSPCYLPLLPTKLHVKSSSSLPGGEGKDHPVVLWSSKG